MKSSTYDIIIVGSGPGGSSAGLIAAKNGYKVLIIEKESLGKDGRYKACGGALGWDLVEKIKLPDEKISRVIESLELHHIDGETYSKKGKGAVVYRSEFDKYLLDLAMLYGAEFKDNEGLGSIEKQDSIYKISTKNGIYFAKYVIAADGINSRTLAMLNWPYFHNNDLVVTITEERKTSSEFIEKNLGKDKVHLYFGINDFIPMGYAWLFPKKDVITFGWGNRKDLLKNHKKEYQRFLNIESVRKCKEKSQSWIYRGHLIPVGVRPLIYKDNVFAIGDAGGFVDPISGKGIPYAMLSGKIAIDTIKNCELKENTNNNKNIQERYNNELNSQFLNSFRLKREARERIYQNDENLKKFLSLWEKYRSSEIVKRNLI